MSLFCNYCRIGLTHVISVREIFVSVEIGSINVCHWSKMAGEIVLGNREHLVVGFYLCMDPLVFQHTLTEY